MTVRQSLVLAVFLGSVLGASRLGAQTTLVSKTPVHDPAWSYLWERGARISAAEAGSRFARGEFTPGRASGAAFGFSSDAVWLAVQLRNTGPHRDWHLLVDYPILDRVAFLEPGGGLLLESGDSLPYSTRMVEHRAFVLPLDLPPGGQRTVLIRVSSRSSLTVPLSVERTSHLAAEQDRTTLIHGLLLGLMLVMAVYNAFVFLSTREPAYILYVAYILSIAVFNAFFSGIGGRYLLPESPALANGLHSLFGGFALTFGLGFAYAFLDAGRAFPKGRYALLFFLGVAILATVTAPFVGNVGTNFLTLVMFGVMNVTAVVSLKRGLRAARFFLLAWSGYTVLAVLWVLAAQGVLASRTIFEFGLSAGASLEVVLLSLALADRINLLRREREEALGREIQTKKRLVDSFSRFVPVQFLRELGRESVEDVTLGEAARRRLTILFSDIRDFTALSEQMDVEDNFRFLNAYLGRMGPIIQERQGFIDKFIGDAVMALFTSADQALAAGIEMLRALREYNTHRAGQGYPPIRLGVGLHTGTVMLGTIGSFSRMDSTVIGDAVNLASRIEGLTKRIGLPLLLSSEVLADLPPDARFGIREVASVRARGKKQLTHLYECWDHELPEAQERRQDLAPVFERALEHFRRREFEAACTAFEEGLQRCPSDPPSLAYLERCRQLVARGLTGAT